MIIPRREQFSGCLIGQCLGDALGFPVEGHSPEACRKYVENILRAIYNKEQIEENILIGQYTDDSQLARELLQSYVECKKFEPRDYARRIAAIFSEDRIVGRGRATELAAMRLAKGIPWEEAGTPPGSAGNGSAMRAGPIGLMFFDDPQELIFAAHDQGRITHKDSRCSAGAVAIAGAVALSLQNKQIDTYHFLTQLGEWTKKFDRSAADFIQQLNDWVKLPPEEAVNFISRAGLEPGYSYRWEGISPFVTGSVLWSLYSFLRTPDDYRETICTAIAVGGDVDTTAAMAGAVSGAYNGLGAVPSHLTSRLTDLGTWGFSELVELADKCYNLKMSGIKGEPVVRPYK